MYCTGRPYCGGEIPILAGLQSRLAKACCYDRFSLRSSRCRELDKGNGQRLPRALSKGKGGSAPNAIAHKSMYPAQNFLHQNRWQDGQLLSSNNGVR
jgi:hypothetical protein